jgi:hypothetical protein
MDERRVRARARRAYELGRLRHGLPWAAGGAIAAMVVAAIAGVALVPMLAMIATAFAVSWVAASRGPSVTRFATPVLIGVALVYFAVCCAPSV